MADAAPLALTTKLLRQSHPPAEFDFYKAALEWSLVDPIIINSRADPKSKSRWKSQGLEPYHHQVTNLINFCRRLPVTLLADDVGLGKTISAGLVASELISRKRISRLFSDRFQMLVLDEAHKLRNLYGTPQTPQVAKCFRKVLEEACSSADVSYLAEAFGPLM